MSKSQIISKTNFLEFWISVIVICPSTWLRVVSLSNHLVFVFCYLKFLIAETRHLTPSVHF